MIVSLINLSATKYKKAKYNTIKKANNPYFQLNRKINIIYINHIYCQADGNNVDCSEYLLEFL